jgi:hypothetical protein
VRLVTSEYRQGHSARYQGALQLNSRRWADTNYSIMHPLPARLLFRVLEAPLGVAAAVAGPYFLVLGITTMGQGWVWLELVVMGPLITAFGVFGVIHAFTGSLPDWIVNQGDDDSSTPDSPAA